MLLIDGVKYELWTPPNEDEFERMVKEHAKDIFGEESMYFDLKQKLKSRSGIGSIPDGYVVVFEASPCWHIVEIELSSRPLYEHIVTQISKFISGIKNLNTQREISEAIYEEINKDDLLKLKVKRAIEPTETYRFLSDLISKPPMATIIIEKYAEQLDDALSALAHSQIKVVEFQTFARQGVVDLQVHAHLFVPLYDVTRSESPLAKHIPLTPRPVRRQHKGITMQSLMSAGLIEPGQRLFKTYKGKRYEAEVMPGGRIRLLHDNTIWNSPSGASDHITSTSTDGWEFWNTIIDGQERLIDDLRKRLKPAS